MRVSSIVVKTQNPQKQEVKFIFGGIFGILGYFWGFHYIFGKGLFAKLERSYYDKEKLQR